MELTKKQEDAVKIILDRHRMGEKYTVIAGFAGTGKTTLVKFAIEALDVEEDKVAYVSFTGKAAEVLRRKGNPNATTLHKLLYTSFPRAAGGFIRKPKPQLEYTIVVVDEISMVPKELVNLLFKHKVYVICLGDPFQLPPIDKDEDNHLLDNPHIFLDEIMRQEEQSEIIQLTMKIREGKPIEYFKGDQVQVIPYSELNTGMLLWGDQILTGTNAKRLSMNAQMRALLGKGPEPEDGDKVICLRNYWDSFNINGDPLVNGTIGTMINSFRTWREIPKFVKSDIRKFDIICCDFISDEGVYEMTEMDRVMMLTGMKCCDWRLSYKLGKLKPRYGEIIPKEFAYAYAITYWKAQGSEWDKVIVLEEKFPFDKETHDRAMYTAITRARDKVIWVRP